MFPIYVWVLRCAARKFGAVRLYDKLEFGCVRLIVLTVWHNALVLRFPLGGTDIA
jgi:hypothetical protein